MKKEKHTFCNYQFKHTAVSSECGQSGNFQLNVMLPLIAYNLLQSIELLGNASRVLADNAIKGFRVNEDNIKAALDKNPILVTALAKKAYAENAQSWKSH